MQGSSLPAMTSYFAVAASLNSLSADMKAMLETIPGDLLIRCEGQEERVHSIVLRAR